MEKEKIERINTLARKSKTEGLTEAEIAEQKALRDEYIQEFRAQFKSTLEHTVVEYPDGSRKKLDDVKDEIKKQKNR